jgi:hypothetical protein
MMMVCRPLLVVVLAAVVGGTDHFGAREGAEVVLNTASMATASGAGGGTTTTTSTMASASALEREWDADVKEDASVIKAESLVAALERVRLNRAGHASAAVVPVSEPAATQAATAQEATDGVKPHRGIDAKFGHGFAVLTIADGSTFLHSMWDTVQRALTNFLSYHVAEVLGLGSHCPRALLLSETSAAAPPAPFDTGDMSFFKQDLFHNEGDNLNRDDKIKNGYQVVTEKVGSVVGLELVNVSRCFAEDGAVAGSFGACAIPKDDETSAKFVYHLFW